MSGYPTVITQKTIETNAHISSATIEKDILDTQAEIDKLCAEVKGHAILADAQIGTPNGKMAAFRRDGNQARINKRQKFAQFLEALLTARRAQENPNV